MYENFYKFHANPFRLSPDPAFFFDSPGHKRALSYLRYGLTQQEGFIVVTGVPGTGKTTLARTLLSELKSERVVVGELNNTHLQADDVLRMTAATFGLEHEGLPKASLLKRLENFFLTRYQAGYHSLLLIDEAQNLPHESLEELRMLSNFYSGTQPLVQIFLLGQEQFRDILHSPDMEQLRQRVVAACHLEPLSEIETLEYIEHRLTQVGWDNDPEITDEAFELIFQLTKGIPRRINTFCDRLFLFASIEELHVIDEDVVADVGQELMYEVAVRQEKQSSLIKKARQKKKIKQQKEEQKQLEEQAGKTAEDPSSVNKTAEQHKKEPEVAEKTASSTVEKPALPPKTDDKPAASKVQPIKSDAPVKAPEITLPKSEPEQGLRIVASAEQATNSKSAAAEAMPAAENAPAGDPPSWLPIIKLILEYHRFPEKHQYLSDVSIPIPDNLTDVLKIAAGQLSPSQAQLDKWLDGIKPDEIKEAIRFFLKNALLGNGADYYRRLGLDRHASEDQIQLHYRLMFRLCQPDQEKEPGSWSEVFSRRINQAYSTLRDKKQRNQYEEFLQELKRNQQAAASVPPGTNLSEQTVFVDSAQASAVAEQDPAADSKRKLIYIISGAVVLTGALVVGQLLLGEGESLPPVAEAPEAPENQTRIERVQERISKLESQVAEENRSLQQDSNQNVKVTPKAESQPEVQTRRISSTPVKTRPVLEEPKPSQSSAVEIKAKPSAEGETKLAEAPKPESKKIKTEAKTQTPVIADSVAKREVTKPVERASVEEKAAPVLNQQALQAVVDRFMVSYEHGRLDDFVALFAINAKTQDGSGRSSVRQDYQGFFQATAKRSFIISDLKWDIGNDRATGKGRFNAEVYKNKTDRPRKFAGNITLEINTNLAGKPEISGFFWEYAK